MLVVVIFKRLSKPHRGQPRLVKRVVVAAASVATLAENHWNGAASAVSPNRAGEFASRRISVIDFAVPRKNAHAMRPAGRGIGSDDIVIQHPAHRVALFLDPVDKVRAP